MLSVTFPRIRATIVTMEKGDRVKNRSMGVICLL
jgi:hypothetical protein